MTNNSFVTGCIRNNWGHYYFETLIIPRGANRASVFPCTLDEIKDICNKCIRETHCSTSCELLDKKEFIDYTSIVVLQNKGNSRDTRPCQGSKCLIDELGAAEITGAKLVLAPFVFNMLDK